jgi:hypothetical protein
LKQTEKPYSDSLTLPTSRKRKQNEYVITTAQLCPRYKKVKTGEKKEYSVCHMDWFNVDIDEQGIEYQVAFLFAELLALMFGCHDDCFAYARNKEMWNEGPYDKHTIKLSKLTQK